MPQTKASEHGARSVKDLIIYGTGMIAEIADFYFMHDDSRRVVAFTTHAEFLDRKEYLGRPVIPFESLRLEYPPATHELFAAISYAGVNSVRAKRVAEIRSEGYDLTSYLSSKATTWPGFKYGYNCFILEHNNIQPFTEVGNNVTLWSCNHIGHHVVIEDDCFVASGVIVSGGATIGKGSFLGVNATIRDGVKIGKRCVIGAAAVVLHDLPDETVLGSQETPKSAVPSSRLRSI